MRYALYGVLLVLAATNAQSQQSAGGSIGGAVLDPDRAPIANLMIVVATATGSPSTYGTRTDANGRYRVSNISPGRYHVKAGGCPAVDLSFHCPTNAPIWVYHPGTDSRDAATVVSVVAGNTRDDVNFTLSRAYVEAMWKEGARMLAQASELWAMRRYAPATRTTWSSLDEMHGYFEATFIATPGMGSGRMSGQSMQIDPGQRLKLSHEEGSTGEIFGTWAVSSLDLIGLAKHEQPVVFSRTAHGAYAQADRRLTEFEQQSLSALRLGRNTVTRSENGELLLVGAIRARSDCLGCHQTYREGDLLGALRYVLHRTQVDGR